MSPAEVERPRIGPGASAGEVGALKREVEALRREAGALRERFSRLSAASLRIGDTMDFDSVLQETVDSARALISARLGAIVTLDGSANVEELFTSGVTPEQSREFHGMSRRHELLAYLTTIRRPLRVPDLAGRMQAAGFPPQHPAVRTFLGVPIRHREEHIGNFFLAEKEGGSEFTAEDEETLMMFASQAGMVITNAHRYREERRAKSDLEALVSTSPVGVLVFDAKTFDVVSLNNETRRLVGSISGSGRDLDHILKVVSLQRTDGTEIPRKELPTARAVRSGETVRAEDIVIVLPDGTRIPTLVNATPIFSDDGEVASVVATVQDMTPREELERLRSDFLGMVSHELRAPLAAIKGSAATLLGSTSPIDPAETRQFFRIVDQQADHMRGLINDLLDLSRVEAGALSVTPESTDLADVVEQARIMFLSAGAHNDVQVEMAPALPRVSADRERMIQVIHNVLSNASKYSPAASTIRVSASLDGVHVAIAISDEGEGVSPEDLPGLFTKFSRLHDEDGRQIPGAGLGLAICKGIVEAHGGRIWAESDGPGLGMRVTFTVPIAPGAAEDPEAGPEPHPAQLGHASGENARVLVLDDDPYFLRYVRRTLSDAGFSPIVTGDPNELERLLTRRAPDLVLLDLILPGTDGFALMESIPALKTVPVIFVSGHAGDQYVARALDTGADDYITKPFSPTELVARVRAALRKRTVAERVEDRAPLRLGDLTIDYAQRSVTVAGNPVDLTATEYKLLCELSANPGRVLTHDQLMKSVWGPEYGGDTQLVRSFVKSLRQKLADDAKQPAYIFTVPRVGYRLAKP